VLFRSFENYQTEQWTAAQRVLRYVLGTKHYVLVIGDTDNIERSSATYGDRGTRLAPIPNSNLVGYSDADWGGCKTTKRSTAGRVLFYNKCIISWSAKRMNLITQSSHESELVSLNELTKEMIFKRNLLCELQCPETEPSILCGDNASSLNLVRGVDSSRTRHIDIRLFYVREQERLRNIKVTNIPSYDMRADIMTKTFTDVTKLTKLRKAVCVFDPHVV